MTPKPGENLANKHHEELDEIFAGLQQLSLSKVHIATCTFESLAHISSQLSASYVTGCMPPQALSPQAPHDTESASSCATSQTNHSEYQTSMPRPAATIVLTMPAMSDELTWIAVQKGPLLPQVSTPAYSVASASEDIVTKMAAVILILGFLFHLIWALVRPKQKSPVRIITAATTTGELNVPRYNWRPDLSNQSHWNSFL